LALTWPTSGGRSVGIARLRTKAREFISFEAIQSSSGAEKLQSRKAVLGVASVFKGWKEVDEIFLKYFNKRNKHSLLKKILNFSRSSEKEYCHMIEVTVDGVWIGTWIY
jgi:hypothetical protein